MPPSPFHHVDLSPACLPGVDTVAISSEHTFPRHAHDQFGIGVMRAGGHASWSGRGQVEAGPGDVIASSPDEMHDGAPIGGPRAWEMVFVEPETVERLVGPEAARREIGFPVARAPALSAQVLDVRRALLDGDARAAEERLTGLLADVLSPASPASYDAPSPATRRVIERIRDSLGAPATLDEVAALMGMERTSALRRFRRELGATPQDYAMQQRLRRARRLLAAGDTPADVSHALGFADQSHLTRAFARQYGLPPGRYRTHKAKILQDADGLRRR